ncbi:MAG: glycosyltransferase family 2 protein [Verrucomicrobiota bacterium]
MMVLFWLCVLTLGYTFFVYPALIFLRSRFEKPVRRSDDARPMVSVLVPVFNEEAVIEEKLANSLEIDYPADRLEVAVASDGSTDGTVAALESCNDPGLTVFAYPENRGKTAVLNETIPRLKGDLVLLTDATGMLNPEVAKSMARFFADEDVGCVCGIYHIIKKGRSRMDTAESSYHGFEMMLRLWEGRIRTTLSGTGSLCMIRRSDYEPLPEGVINEDYILPARMALGGKRVLYDTGAHIHDRLSTSIRDVFRRRVRIAYGNWQQIGYLKALLNPLSGYLFWVFLSHKLLRMMFPFLLLVLFVSSWAISPTLFLILAAGLGMMTVGSLAALALDSLFKGHNPLAFVALVFFNCLAVFWGTAKFFAGAKVKW